MINLVVKYNILLLSSNARELTMSHGVNSQGVGALISAEDTLSPCCFACMPYAMAPFIRDHHLPTIMMRYIKHNDKH